MSKKLLGSLTVASAAPLPQELPPAARLAALIDRAVAGADASTTASILRTKLGSYVQPVSGGGFVAKTMLRQGEHFVLNGQTLGGKLAQMVVKDVVRDFVPKWARKVAAVALFAGSSFGKIINEFITGAGLPIDPDVDWDRRLHDIFASAGVKNEEERQDAIQDAVISIFLTRNLLERFDPERGKSQDGRETPLNKRLTAYLTRAFRWQATGKSEAGDHARQRQFDSELTTDEPLSSFGIAEGNEDATLADVTVGDYVDQEAEAHSESVIRSLDQFMDAFGAYLQKARGGNLAKTCVQLLKLIISAHDAAEVKARWPIETGTSYSNMRRILPIVAQELLKFSETSTAPNIALTQLLNKLRQRLIEQAGTDAVEEAQEAPTSEPAPTPAPVEDTEQVGTKAKEMQTDKTSSVTICASAEDFMVKLAAYVHELRKEAAPKVVEQSILYLRMGGNRANPRFMDIAFYSPKLRTLPGAGSYKIEVGDWGQDKSLPERRIRQAVGTFVIPMMRGDVLEEDHDLLEKVIRRLRSIVWENAVEYFQVPFEEKPEWRNTVKMDIARLLDTKVTIQDPEQGTIEIAASLVESAHGRKAARRVAAFMSRDQLLDLGNRDDLEEFLTHSYNEQDDHPEGYAGETPGRKRQIAVKAECEDCDSAWTPVGPRPTWNEKTQQWDPADKTPGGLLGGQPAPYGSKRAKALMATPGGYRKQHADIPYPQAQIGDTVQYDKAMFGLGAKEGVVVGLRLKEHKLVVRTPNGDEVVGMSRITRLIPKQARSLGGELNLTPAEQTDFAPYPDKTAGDVRSVEDEAEIRKNLADFISHGKWRHDGHGLLALDNSGAHISQASALPLIQLGLISNGGTLAYIVTPRGKAFLQNQPQTPKEAHVTNAKFAALKRIAAENPEAVAEAIDGLKAQLSEQLNNLTILQENLGIKQPVEGAEVKEGEPMEVQDVEGPEKFAGLKHLAAEEPAQIEEAFGEFYLAMDKVMAQTEALADNLDITLPDAAPVDVEEEAAEEGESVPAEIAEGGSDTDDAPHGEQPAAEEPATVE